MWQRSFHFLPRGFHMVELSTQRQLLGTPGPTHRSVRRRVTGRPDCMRSAKPQPRPPAPAASGGESSQRSDGIPLPMVKKTDAVGCQLEQTCYFPTPGGRISPRRSVALIHSPRDEGRKARRANSQGKRLLNPDCQIYAVDCDGTVTVIVEGELDLSAAPVLERQLYAAEMVRRRSVIVDLDRVTFIDSAGLHVLIAHSRPGRHQGRPAL